MPTTCDILLKADWIVTQNRERQILRHAGLAVAGGKILELGPWPEMASRYAPHSPHSHGHTLDLGNSLLLPGLVNTHTHAAMTLFRGLADDMPLMEWLGQRIWPIEAKLTKETVRVGSQLACAEMIRFGTACFADMYVFQEETAKAVEQTGIRAVLAEGILGFPTRSYSTLEEALALNEGLMDRYHDQPRLKFAIAPHAIYTTTPEILEKSFALAERRDVPWMIHLAESPGETAQCLEQFGKRPVAYLNDLGLLGSRTVVVHAVDINEKEIALLAQTGTRVAHNPRSNMKLGNGFAPVRRMREQGIVVGLGTDGAASNNALNMFGEMAATALGQKIALSDPTALKAGAVLDMATRDGAAILGLPGMGCLEPGAPADLIALDLSAPNMQPLYNPVSQAVYAATGAEVRLNMVDGKILYQDGRFLTVDYQALLEEVEDIRKWVLKAAG